MKKGLLLLPLAMAMGNVQAEEGFSWTGFYAGANVGLSSYQTDTQDYWCWYACDAPNTVEDGLTYGIQTGYNYQVDDNFVVGLELDYSTGLDSSESYTYQDTSSSGGAKWDSEWKSLMSLRMKAGLAVERTLVYVTGGVAQAEAEFEAREFVGDANGADYAEADETLSGFIYGVGVEHAFSDMISARLEYLTTSMEREETCWADNRGCEDANDPGNDNDDVVAWTTSGSSLRLGVNMLF